ncbi:MAG: hypothetical protein KHW62_05040 [Clostridiales bacterium]|nr:hypothetical protein [Clostridiales bacterium]
MFNIDRNILETNSRRWNYKELTELISEAEKRLNEVAVRSSEKNYQSLLIDFFGKAILYSKEILTILYDGYPDGAMSLARELFENSVTLSFIERHKNDDTLLERYFDSIELSSLSDSIKLLLFLRDGASDKKTITDLTDMIDRKKRSHAAIIQKYTSNSITVFRKYWWIGDILEEKDKNFYGILKNTVWDKTIFKHIYNMSKHNGHSTIDNLNSNDVAISANPSTEGFQLPLCFTISSFQNICKIVFINDEINFSDIDNRLNKITKPMFSEIWK